MNTSAVLNSLPTRILGAVCDTWRRPNPLWIRELRQASRIKRTPLILMAVTILAAIAMGAVSGMSSDYDAPAEIGATLFQVFFSMAFFLVALIGPAMGANCIAAEREGKTWEPLILTGFPARAMARGKFLAALTSVLQYLAILAPVGALPFLFGGVSAFEVVIAFLCLTVFSCLGVGFGLAVGSSLTNGRAAIVVAIVCAAVLAVAGYLILGVELGREAHRIWGNVPRSAVWFPNALANVPVSTPFIVLLVVQPVVGALVSGWLFYEVTAANMTSAFKDQCSGLLRWFTVMTPLLAAALAAPLVVEAPPWLDRSAWRALAIMVGFLLFAAVLFQGTPVRPSKPGPGLIQTMTRLMLGGLLCFALLTTSTLAIVADRAAACHIDRFVRFVGCTGWYFGGFVVFVIGLAAWLRTRVATVGAARVWLCVVLLLTISGPFVIAAVSGVLSDDKQSSLAFAAPSPGYTLLLSTELSKPEFHDAIANTVLCGLVWALLGLGFFGSAMLRSRAAIRAHEAMAPDPASCATATATKADEASAA